LKKTGKKPAITVVAKAELAQSYRAHPQICLLFFIMDLDQEERKKLEQNRGKHNGV
jgi:hypothetical protein